MNTPLHGFTEIRQAPLPELDATLHEMEHAQTGARLVYLACDDENKAFAIAFKTPPANSTGVFHILEHSVLCGSDRYPVKEPFVELLKHSMNTFLNALTFPDKTLYPISSRNPKDFLTLMRVYLDAVFHPAIYHNPAIFRQEGWRYEFDADGTPHYKGVVFNEMKGAFSDADELETNALNRALFPDTPYRYVSGGDPACIPDLSYEQFLAAHRRFYAPSNALIFLDGAVDLDTVLRVLDEEYLRSFARSERTVFPPLQAPVDGGVQRIEYEVASEAEEPGRTRLGYGFVLGSYADRETLVAAGVLAQVLAGDNESPLCRAVLSRQLARDLMLRVYDSVAQPWLQMEITDLNAENAAAAEQAVFDELRRLAGQGIDRTKLEAALARREFEMRGRDFGPYTPGVGLCMQTLESWLYGGQPEANLQVGDLFDSLRAKMQGGYFEDLLRELVLQNDHMALVELVPVDATEGSEGAEAAELAAKRDAMTDAELADVVERTAALRAAQEAEDTPEAKATLPRLRVSDIGEARPEPPLVVDTTAPIPCLRHGIPTNRLAYAMQYFDLSCVAFEDLPYVTLLCRLLKQLPTREHSAEELDNLLAGKLGFLSFTTEVMTQPEVDGVRPYLLVSAGALSEKIDALASLPREVWSSTLLADADADRVRDVLTQIRIGLEQGFINNGHSAALGRAMSYSSPSAVVREQLSGVDFYLFLRDLLDHFDERLDGLRAKLAELAGRIFVADGCLASFTGSDEDFNAYWADAGDLGLGAGDGADAGRNALVVPTPCDRHEAFVIPSDICFAARACDPRRLGIDVTGAWAVAANALSYDYLWNEIRVKGGAYGCGFRAAGERQTAFYTYRDPAIDPSIERVERAGAWLGSFEPDEAAFEGFIVSCVSGMDAPVKPYALTKRRNTTYLAGLDPHAREERRAQMLAATPGELRTLGADVTRIAAESPTCVFGGRDVIAKSNAGFNVVDLLG